MDSNENYINYTLLGAIEASDINAVSELLSKGADPNYTSKPSSHSLLHRALEEKDLKIIELLIQNGAKVNEDLLDKTFIFYDDEALQEIIVMIVKHNNDINLIQKIFSKLIRTEFHNTEVLNFLLDYGLPVNGFINQYTPLQTAIIHSRNDFVSTLLDRGADVNKKAPNGEFSLSLAVTNTDLPMVKLLIKQGAKINRRDKTKRTVLFKSKTLMIDRILLEHGAKLNILDKNKYTPLTYTDNHQKKLLLVKELAKLKFDDQKVYSRNLNHITKNLDLQTTFTECLKELQKMKDSKVYNNVSFHDVLKMGQQMKKITLLAKKKEFVTAFESSTEIHKFTFYAKDLRRIFAEAKSRRDAVEAAEQKIYESDLDKEFLLPPEIMEIIVSFATDHLYFERAWETSPESFSEYEDSESESSEAEYFENSSNMWSSDDESEDMFRW